MRIDSYKPPKSSFLSVEKDLSSIVDFIFRNERLKKLSNLGCDKAARYTQDLGALRCKFCISELPTF